jgi:hypothetical protein
LEIVVADGRASQANAAVVLEFRCRPFHPIRYLNAERNPHNAARLAAMEGGVDFILLIDDDQVAPRDWVRRRYQQHLNHSAARALPRHA